jgi:exopolysaccharide biosynthesis polyprenyl glycosylphosphotransferase
MPFNTGASAAKLYGELYELLFWDVYTMPADSFFESLSGRISFASLQDSWFFENLQPHHASLYEVIQRVIDYIFATLGLLALIVLTPFVALATKIQSPGPLFYLQERIGKSGRRFKVIKFRTMHALEKDGGAELSGAQFTTQDDPRITKIGKIIRSLRIDELPQVINVLKGEMSIIGPRPERPQFVEQFEKHMPYYTVRNLVKPGLTGWAQINYPYAETTEQQLTKFQYDLFYIKNRSLMLDITIILKTIHVILYGKGR